MKSESNKAVGNEVIQSWYFPLIRKKKTELVSIPRDTKAEIAGRGTEEKINHAYAYGGPNMAVKTIEKLMNVPIDHYATIDMDGLHDMIDTLGGVDVVSNSTFTMGANHFVKGEKHT